MRAADEHIRTIIRGVRHYGSPLSTDHSFSRDENLIVRAGAGSGKTSVLIERMVALIRSGVPIEELVAITFTRKAAAEMRGRFHDELLAASSTIQDALGRAIKDGVGETVECYQRELELLTIAVESSKSAFIDTIHSFCSLLLRGNPFDTGLSSDFTIMDADQETVFRRQFWNQYLSDAAQNNDATISCLSDLGISPADLFSYFGDRCELSHIPVDTIVVEEPDLTAASEAVSHFLDGVLSVFPHAEPVDRLSSRAFEYARFKRIHSLDVNSNRASLLSNLSGTIRQDATLYPDSIKVTKWGQDKSSQSRQMADSLKKPTSGSGNEESLAEFVVGSVRPALLQWRQYLQSKIDAFVSPAVKAYDLFRREAGQLTYTDLMRLSVNALRSNEGFRTAANVTYRRILVDEFQDTDPLQSELIFLIASGWDEGSQWLTVRPAPGSLFFVGDEKQSIYRFRQADVQVFDAVCTRIDRTGGRMLELTSNFRSVDAICSWINQSVGPLFAGHAADFQSPFNDLESTRAVDGERTTIWQNPIEKIFRNDAVKIATTDAEQIVRTILDSCSPGGKSTLGLTECSYGDFLILVRTSHRMRIYAAALERAGIPFTTAGSRALSHQAVLFPLLDLIDTLFNPHDPIARLAYLRGPFAGLSDDALYQFVRKKGVFIDPSAVPPGLSEFQETAFHFAFETLSVAQELLSRGPLSSALEELISARGLMASFLLNDGASANAGAMMRLVSLIRSWEAKGLSWTEVRLELHRVAQGEIVVEGMTLEAGQQDVVRLYNVHQAKGLESRVVFLADPMQKDSVRTVDYHIDRSGAHERLLMPVQVRYGRHAKVIAEPQGWNAAVERENHFADAENMRLLYVASTRARDALVISRYIGNETAGTWSPLYSALHGDDIGQLTGSETDFARSPDQISRSGSRGDDLIDALSKNLETSRRTLEHVSVPSYEAVSVSRLADALTADIEPSAAIKGGKGRGYGNAIHRLLERAVNRRNVATEATLEQTVTEQVLKEEIGKSGTSFQAAASKTIEAFTNSDLWQELLVADEVWTELEFVFSDTAKGKQIVVSGKIDLAYQKEGVWSIVDYKTDRTARSVLVEKYGPQVRQYAQALGALTGSGEVRCGLWWTHEHSWIPV